MARNSLMSGSYRRRWIVCHLAAGALLSGCGKVFEPDPQITRRFESIKIGMSRTAVEQTMQIRPTLMSTSTFLGIEIVRLSWQDGLSILNVDFVAEHVVAKHRVSRPQ